MAVSDGEYISPTQCLANVTLTLDFAHAQSEAADPPCMMCDALKRGGRFGLLRNYCHYGFCLCVEVGD